MAIIKKTIDITKPLSDEQRNRVIVAASKPLAFDEDAPELTESQIEEIKGVIDSRRFDEIGQDITVHLTESSMEKVKTFGSDYKGILNRFMNLAISEPELLKKAMLL